MEDPRMQGMAKLVQIIGSMTGAVDPSCITLDQWRRLSLAQRAAQHITDAAMAETEYRHHCRPPADRVGPGANPLNR